MHEPAAASPHSITTVPRSAALMATQVRPRTRSPRQSQPPNPAMKGERLWMTSVFATEVCARAMMKHVEAVAKQAAISTQDGGPRVGRDQTGEQAATAPAERRR